MKKSRLTMVIVLLVSGVILLGLIIPAEVNPPKDTRVILEHHDETYIAPSCFQQAEASNYLEETTLEAAKSLNYPPESRCTEAALEAEKSPLIIALLKKFGLLATPWDHW